MESLLPSGTCPDEVPRSGGASRLSFRSGKVPRSRDVSASLPDRMSRDRAAKLGIVTLSFWIACWCEIKARITLETSYIGAV